VCCVDRLRNPPIHSRLSGGTIQLNTTLSQLSPEKKNPSFDLNQEGVNTTNSTPLETLDSDPQAKDALSVAATSKAILLGKITGPGTHETNESPRKPEEMIHLFSF